MNWAAMSLREFQAALASSSPTPGGGTAAAVALGQAAALSIMVCDLTLGKEKWADGWSNSGGDTNHRYSDDGASQCARHRRQ